MKNGYTVVYSSHTDAVNKVYYSIDSATKAALTFMERAHAGDEVILYESCFSPKGTELYAHLLWANYLYAVADLHALAGLDADSVNNVNVSDNAYTFS